MQGGPGGLRCPQNPALGRCGGSRRVRGRVPGRSSPDTQRGLPTRCARGLFLLKERHTERGRAGRPLPGWNCDPSTGSRFVHRWQGRRVRVGPTRLSQPSVRGTAGDSLLWAGPVQQCCLDLARASWLCGPLLSAAVAPPWCGTPCPSPPLSMDSQGLPSISATGHCHEAPREPVRVSSPLRAGAARTRGSLHLPKVATATSPAARAPLKERP